MGHLPNSKHSKYGYKKAHTFTLHWDICYYVKQRTYEIFLSKSAHIIYSDTGTHANSEHMKY